VAKHEIEYTESALEDIAFLKPFAQRQVFDAVDQQLTYEPVVATRNRKPLDENLLAPWELRVGTYRVFYSVDAEQRTVRITAIGYKTHNKLYIRGKEYQL
jgi:mRNA-degrading endonuclease RelE of RelBE toxin-antitoxin system